MTSKKCQASKLSPDDPLIQQQPGDPGSHRPPLGPHQDSNSSFELSIHPDSVPQSPSPQPETGKLKMSDLPPSINADFLKSVGPLLFPPAVGLNPYILSSSIAGGT